MSDLLNQASLVMIPSGYKEDIVYSEIPIDGSGDLQLTRASNGTRVNSSGLVEVTPWNLVEQSETFDNATWQKSGIAVTANAAANPLTGLINADNLVADTGNNFHYIYQPITYTTDQHTIFVYLKANGYNWFVIDAGLANKYSYYNLSTGVLGTIGSGATASIESVGNGWYKCGVTFAGVAGSTGIYLSVRNADNGGAFTGNGTGGILAYGAQLNIGSTAKPYFPTTDRLNVPRLTYQNGGGGCPSLLLEKQSTNVALYSEQINSTNYNLSNVTSSENSLTSPDGTTNADKIIESTSNSTHAVTFNASLGGTVDSSPYCISVFVKAEGRSNILFYDNNQTVGGISYFNLSTGVVSSGTGKIENYGNGWYRCTIFCLKDNSTSANIQLYLLDSAGNQTYTGNGTSGVGLWGYQCEASSYPTSYIPTTSSSATRVKDLAYKSGATALIGQTEGVLFCDFNLPSVETSGDYPFIVNMWKDSSNRFGFARYPNGGVHIYMQYGGSAQFTYNTAQLTGRFKLALGYKANDCVIYLNGTLLQTITSATIPATDDIIFNGINTSGDYNTQLQINQTVLFKTRLTNAELASLTTI